MDWIKIEDEWKGPYPMHMQKCIAWIDNPFFGSYEVPAVYLHFKGYDVGDFFNTDSQSQMYYVTKWKLNQPERLNPETSKGDAIV